MPSEFVSEVIPIKYAKASDIASALNSLSSGGGGASMGGAGPRARGAAGALRHEPAAWAGWVGMGGRLSGANHSRDGHPARHAGTTPTGAAGNSFSSRLQNIISRASATGEIQVLGQTKIISDERTNSLLIYAGKDDMKTIKEIMCQAGRGAGASAH
jgi:type II secretory pathway component GspD/PulD (secretin)